jgi:hypothetical protein
MTLTVRIMALTTQVHPPRILGLILLTFPSCLFPRAHLPLTSAKLMKDNTHWLSVSDELLNHRCAQEPYAAVTSGVSLDGGQMVSNYLPFPLSLLMSTREPGNLQQNCKNTKKCQQQGVKIYSTVDSLPLDRLSCSYVS